MEIVIYPIVQSLCFVCLLLLSELAAIDEYLVLYILYVRGLRTECNLARKIAHHRCVFLKRTMNLSTDHVAREIKATGQGAQIFSAATPLLIVRA